MPTKLCLILSTAKSKRERKGKRGIDLAVSSELAIMNCDKMATFKQELLKHNSDRVWKNCPSQNLETT